MQEMQRLQQEGISAGRESDSDEEEADVTVGAPVPVASAGPEEDLFGDEDAGEPMQMD